MQDLKTICLMKTVNQNSTARRNSFAQFSTVALNKQQQSQIKGGDDIIVIEDLIDA